MKPYRLTVFLQSPPVLNTLTPLDATIAGIIRHAYAAHRDGQKGGAGSRPRTKKTKRRTRWRTSC